MKRQQAARALWFVLGLAAFAACRLGLAVVGGMTKTGHHPVAMFYIPGGLFAIPVVLPALGFLFYLVAARCFERVPRERNEPDFLLLDHPVRGAFCCSALALLLAFTPLAEIELS